MRKKTNDSLKLRCREIGERVLKIRRRLGMRQKDLALLSGVHYLTIGYIEVGKVIPSLASLLLICDTLKVPVSKLLEEI